MDPPHALYLKYSERYLDIFGKLLATSDLICVPPFNFRMDLSTLQ